MRFNLVSNLHADSAYEHLQAYNHIIAWSLREELNKAGHEATLVPDDLTEGVPETEHTIVVSNTAFTRIPTDGPYYRALTEKTSGRFTLWLDGAFPEFEGPYDRILTVAPVPPSLQPGPFRQVGWAANPDRFTPKQQGPAAFVDSYMYGWYEGRYDKTYDTIKQALQESGIRVLQPTAQYNHGRIHWIDLQALFNQATHHVSTQICHWGWTEIEAATAGATLILQRQMDRPDTWPSKLIHELWDTKEQLVDILNSEYDPAFNRGVALENTWPRVIKRIEEALR